MKERLLHRMRRWFRDFRDRHDLRYTINQLRRSRAAWEDTAAQYSRDCDYYRGLVVRCGELFGEDARRQDDGGIVDHVLCAKVPELVAELVDRCAGQAAALRQAETVDGMDAHQWKQKAESFRQEVKDWQIVARDFESAANRAKEEGLKAQRVRRLWDGDSSESENSTGQL